MNWVVELLKFLLGFLPWLLFLFISGHTLASLERSIVICLFAILIFGFRDLRRGFILQWVTLLFFIACVITVNLMKSAFVAENMGIISNGFIAGIIWVTIFIGKPFTLQYARADLPKERWDEPGLIQSCRFIAIIWALLLSFSAFVSIFRVLNPKLFPDNVYFDISIAIILGGSLFTILYKKYKRDQYKQMYKRTS